MLELDLFPAPTLMSYFRTVRGLNFLELVIWLEKIVVGVSVVGKRNAIWKSNTEKIYMEFNDENKNWKAEGSELEKKVKGKEILRLSSADTRECGL